MLGTLKVIGALGTVTAMLVAFGCGPPEPDYRQGYPAPEAVREQQQPRGRQISPPAGGEQQQSRGRQVPPPGGNGQGNQLFQEQAPPEMKSTP